MKIVITGGAGFIGRKLTGRLLESGTLSIGGTAHDIESITVFDRVADAWDDPRVTSVTGDIGDAADVNALIGADTGCVFHLAAVVSAEAEADFELGMRINLDGTRHVLEACRNGGQVPRMLFASSIAVYGGEVPDPVTDDTPLTPLTSYGAQKSACEFLVTDYSRKGFIDGVALRFPTVTVRPGKPNKAASTWVSSIVREPLNGIDFTVPVRPDSPMSCISPRCAVHALVHAAGMDTAALGASRAVLLSGARVTAQEMADTVARLGAGRPLGAIHWETDPDIQRIVDGWPRGTLGERAARLGFTTDNSFDDVVNAYVEDDLDAAAAAQ
jgi:nucleoside-diphosphate-sugar epimerase